MERNHQETNLNIVYEGKEIDLNYNGLTKKTVLK